MTQRSNFIKGTPRPKVNFCSDCGTKLVDEICPSCLKKVMDKEPTGGIVRGSLGRIMGMEVYESLQVPSEVLMAFRDELYAWSRTHTNSQISTGHSSLDLLQPNGITINASDIISQSQTSVGIEYLGSQGSILPLAGESAAQIIMDEVPLTPGHQGYSADDFQLE